MDASKVSEKARNLMSDGSERDGPTRRTRPGDATPLVVCLVAPLPPPYGGIAHWTQMLRAHAGGRSDVRLHIVDIAVRWRSVHDHAISKRVLGGALQLGRDLIRLSVIFATRRPRVVHLTSPGQLAVARDLVVATLAKMFRMRLVYHIRFGRVPQIASTDTREWRLMRRVIGMADAVIAIDRSTEEAIKKYSPNAGVVLIPNCFDPGELPKPGLRASGPHRVVYLGWVIPAKGMDELIDAWALVRPEGWRLSIIGPGAASYQRQLLEKYRPEGVEFRGELNHKDAMRELAAADVFVLPSHTEGFPNVVLEAMALGKPIIATGVGAIPEMLANDSGFLVRPKNVTELAAALRSTLANKEIREVAGRRAESRARAEYDIARVFERYINVWRPRAGETVRSGETKP